MSSGKQTCGLVYHDGTSNMHQYNPTAYGKAIGTSNSANKIGGTANAAMGLTTDATKSGIVCVVGDSSITSKQLGKYIIRYKK